MTIGFNTVRTLKGLGYSLRHLPLLDCMGCATRKWRSRNASAQSSVGAKANSPRREPWENCDVHQAPARGESRGSALFRPLRGLFRSRLVPTACAVGYWLSP